MKYYQICQNGISSKAAMNRRMAVLCPCSRPSMYRHVHCQFIRNKWHNFTTIVPVTVYGQGSYVETYSRDSVQHEFCVG